MFEYSQSVTKTFLVKNKEIQCRFWIPSKKQDKRFWYSQSITKGFLGTPKEYQGIFWIPSKLLGRCLGTAKVLQRYFWVQAKKLKLYFGYPQNY